MEVGGSAKFPPLRALPVLGSISILLSAGPWHNYYTIASRASNFHSHCLVMHDNQDHFHTFMNLLRFPVPFHETVRYQWPEVNLISL